VWKYNSCLNFYVYEDNTRMWLFWNINFNVKWLLRFLHQKASYNWQKSFHQKSASSVGICKLYLFIFLIHSRKLASDFLFILLLHASHVKQISNLSHFRFLTLTMERWFIQSRFNFKVKYFFFFKSNCILKEVCRIIFQLLCVCYKRTKKNTNGMTVKWRLV
jgi:hypothetical protein